MRTTKRQVQKSRTKESLLSTAYEVFSRKGFANTRMSDIAEAAGVSHGTVFAHFKTQEALITEAIETYGGKIALRTHELADSCGHLREILSAHLAGIREYEPFYTRLVIENRLLPLAARDVWVSVQSAISFHFSQAARREGLLDGDDDGLPEYMLFNMWVALVHYYLANGDLFAPEGNVMERYGGTLIDSYMRFIEGRGSIDEQK